MQCTPSVSNEFDYDTELVSISSNIVISEKFNLRQEQNKPEGLKLQSRTTKQEM